MAIYDALIIGGGPGGSSAATFLARAGKRVLVLEKEHFPRFHIGESLLPYNQGLFREMGIMPALEAAGFTRKFGAQFHLGNGAKGTKFVFRRGRFTREPEAIQVERARFDHLLLQHAQTSGAEVREGWTVGKFVNSGKTVTVEARDDSGQVQKLEGSFLIDASGRGNLTGNQEGLRVIHPHLKKLAIFGHFDGVKLDEGEPGGDTVIVRLENKWFWLIPLAKEKVSVGCVMDQDEFAEMKMPPGEVFNHIWQSSPVMRDRMQNARLVGEIRTTSDFSYYNRRFTGPRLLRVGDAAGFMDPIFSAGVFLAMFSGKLAAEAVAQSLKAGDDGTRRFGVYEKRVRAAMQFYWEMVENYYTKPFMEIFLEPREKFNLASAVNAVLAGELEGGWRMRWRMRVFFWIVKLQKRWPLVPRISFD
ncbi:MAG TPA: NAD(P)/FAD-dependent oxidoreductase [Verrucomicrobiae bacterium]|nr:NAD(P)/FAD-dependent oxidoreductase [Verrucomicrobiae bacterium]